MTTGGAMSPGTDVLASQFTGDELRLAVAEAHALGLPVTAHAHTVPAAESCVAAGVDGIEHCSCLGDRGFHTPPELAAALAAAGTQVCPTLGRGLGTVPPPQVLALMAATGTTWEGRLAQVTELHRAGVTLISGADSGISPGKPHGVLPEAVIDLVTCGVPPADALVSATSGAARACGLAGRTGRLAPGLDADLLVVDGDPLADPGAIHRILAVFSRGRRVTGP
jgi:imidazolonepropionase-like amidohydrolase